jgi:hypothetical protein
MYQCHDPGFRLTQHAICCPPQKAINVKAHQYGVSESWKKPTFKRRSRREGAKGTRKEARRAFPRSATAAVWLALPLVLEEEDEEDLLPLMLLRGWRWCIGNGAGGMACRRSGTYTG